MQASHLTLTHATAKQSIRCFSPTNPAFLGPIRPCGPQTGSQVLEACSGHFSDQTKPILTSRSLPKSQQLRNDFHLMDCCYFLTDDSLPSLSAGRHWKGQLTQENRKKKRTIKGKKNGEQESRLVEQSGYVKNDYVQYERKIPDRWEEKKKKSTK